MYAYKLYFIDYVLCNMRIIIAARMPALIHKKHIHTPPIFNIHRMIVTKIRLVDHFDAISNMYISFPSNICAIDAPAFICTDSLLQFVAKLPAVNLRQTVR